MKIKISYILQKNEFIEAFDKCESTKISHKIDLFLSIFLIFAGGCFLFSKISSEIIVIALLFIIMGTLTLFKKLRISRLITGVQYGKNKK